MPLVLAIGLEPRGSERTAALTASACVQRTNRLGRRMDGSRDRGALVCLREPANYSPLPP